jgi:AcrR family transcriptional regulator
MERRISRGHKKRERTRRQLLTAGLAVLAEKGDGLTISDVVSRAEVSNGTFYNYFSDREQLVDALAEHSLVLLAAQSAIDTAEEDPAMRFTAASARVLKRTVEDPTWGRAVLRLVDHRRAAPREFDRYLRTDLSEGLAQGRFDFGPDDVTMDAIGGLLLMSICRIVAGGVAPDYIERALECALSILGVAESEATELVARALADPGRRSISAA